MSFLEVRLRLVMILFILVFSIMGVSIPFLVARRGRLDVLSSGPFDLLQCFAVGLICGVATLHILPDAQEHLSAVSDYPIACTVMLCGVFAMVSLNRMVTLVAARNSSAQEGPLNAQEHGGVSHMQMESARDVQGATPTGTHERAMSFTTSGSFHGHVHQRLLLDPTVESTAGIRLKAYLLEVAIAVHSVLVGLGVGIIDESSSAEATVQVITLGVAVCFHQFFEGIAVGNQGVRVGLKGQAGKFMVALFSAACPLGGLLGIAIAARLDTDSDQAHWTIGSLNAFAAGTLVEIGCVDMLPELFSHKHGHHEKISLRAESLRLGALVLGSVVMAVLAIWA